MGKGLSRAELRKAIEARAPLWKQVLKQSLWFALPFGVMWGLGAEPVDAARVAVAPYACSLLSVAVAGFGLGFFFSMVNEGIPCSCGVLGDE